MNNAYYDYESELIAKDTPIAEMGELLLAKLDEVLEKHDHDAEWLVNHYISAVDNLFDCSDMGEDEIAENMEYARREIEIFRKNGYIRFADEMVQDIERFNREFR